MSMPFWRKNVGGNDVSVPVTTTDPLPVQVLNPDDVDPVLVRLDATYVTEVVLGKVLTIYNATGAAAIALSTTMVGPFRLLEVTCHFSAAPTTSENFTVTLNANDGAAYDTVLSKTDPSQGAVTDIAYIPDGEGLICESGDQIDVAYTNTDAVTYGVRIVVEAV